MDANIPLEYLSQLKTISALKVLVAFFAIGSENKGEISCSIPLISKNYDIAQNSVRSGIKELEELGIIEVIQKNTDKANVYKLKFEVHTSKVEAPTSNNEAVPTSKDEPATSNVAVPPSKIEVATSKVEQESPYESYKKATAARKSKEEQDKDINNNINNIDLININIYTENINSFAIPNVNEMRSEEQLKSLAKRIVNEIFLPLAKPLIPQDKAARNKWYTQQSNTTVKLLLSYRTEQIIAAIRYWAEVNPSSRFTSMYFLNFKTKTKYGEMTKVMFALDYYKKEYIAHIEPIERAAEAECKLIEQMNREREEKKLAAEERKRVESMTSEEFVDQHLNKFSHLVNKYKKG